MAVTCPNCRTVFRIRRNGRIAVGAPGRVTCPGCQIRLRTFNPQPKTLAAVDAARKARVA